MNSTKAVTMSSSLAFKVNRKQSELIAPSKQTPHEFKPLSDLDDQKFLRRQMPGIQLYPYNAEMEGKDLVQIIKQAIANALVYYYPLAGRLKEGANGKLTVECTGEGVIFIEANADISLKELLRFGIPPLPQAEDFIYDVPGSAGILHCPLLLLQMTRLRCGGIVFGSRLNHTLCDSAGLFQFFAAVGEMARGAAAPSILPVWSRELLNARDPLQISCTHHVYQEIQNGFKSIPLDDMQKCTFFFGQQEISKLKCQLQPNIKCSRFEILAALFWRCDAMSLNLDPEEVVRLTFAVDVRRKLKNPPLPVGYYGNAFVKPVALSTAGELRQNSLGYALELVRKAKEDVTEEFVRSTVDYIVKNGRPNYSLGRMLHVSDITSVAFKNIDTALGRAIYGGPSDWIYPSTLFVSSKNDKGEDGVKVMMGLQRGTMRKFIMEIEKIMRVPNNMKSSFIVSTL